jgi:hypothetical protein
MRTNHPELLLRGQAHKTILKETVEGINDTSGKSQVSATQSTQKLRSNDASAPASRQLAGSHDITDQATSSSYSSSPPNVGEQKKRNVKGKEKGVELEKWFLVCMPRENEALVKHLPAKDPQVDNNLMQEVRRTYEKVRSKWSQLSKLRAVYKIRLRRVCIEHSLVFAS